MGAGASLTLARVWRDRRDVCKSPKRKLSIGRRSKRGKREGENPENAQNWKSGATDG